MKRWVRGLVPGVKVWLVVLVGLYLAGSASFAAVPVLTTNTLPVICTDVVGSQITFVAGFSSDSPVIFQWRKNSGGGPVNIPGATNTVLTLTNLQLSDSAAYSLLASNASGVTISAGSSLTVNPVPAAVNNVVVSPATQVGNGSNLFTPTWSVASGSLFAGFAPSSTGSGNFSQESGGGVAVLTDVVFGPLATGISGAHPGMTVEGDEGLLQIVMENLLNNAWKFTGRRLNGRIEIGVEEREGSKVYFVRDNGAGFDMDHAKRIFRVFERLHTEAEFPGTGIGLAIVERIVVRHGGKIWAQGVVNEGATFFFTLPAGNQSEISRDE